MPAAEPTGAQPNLMWPSFVVLGVGPLPGVQRILCRQAGEPESVPLHPSPSHRELPPIMNWPLHTPRLLLRHGLGHRVECSVEPSLHLGRWRHVVKNLLHAVDGLDLGMILPPITPLQGSHCMSDHVAVLVILGKRMVNSLQSRIPNLVATRCVRAWGSVQDTTGNPPRRFSLESEMILERVAVREFSWLKRTLRRIRVLGQHPQNQLLIVTRFLDRIHCRVHGFNLLRQPLLRRKAPPRISTERHQRLQHFGWHLGLGSSFLQTCIIAQHPGNRSLINPGLHAPLPQYPLQR
mmetsp:Transcript_17676/g.38912  ORF Transcript_17676/g.38912 Transcript_17676/m.38912 type:complete len:293 (-) Transcript_17676:283-1161(-)